MWCDAVLCIGAMAMDRSPAVGRWVGGLVGRSVGRSVDNEAGDCDMWQGLSQAQVNLPVTLLWWVLGPQGHVLQGWRESQGRRDGGMEGWMERGRRMLKLVRPEEVTLRKRRGCRLRSASHHWADLALTSPARLPHAVCFLLSREDSGDDHSCSRDIVIGSVPTRWFQKWPDFSQGANSLWDLCTPLEDLFTFCFHPVWHTVLLSNTVLYIRISPWESNPWPQCC